MLNNTFLLRFAVSVILLVHSIPGMFNGGIIGFGAYLNKSGLAHLGVLLAWLIKLSHIGAAICLLANKWIRIAGGITIFILIMGIVMVHFKEGWYVVGGGRNGVEFNFLLIFVLLAIMFPQGISLRKKGG
ncbi:hypothetical protein LL912_19510 [Niabella sp. CC-SYL272]|uniref:DoxX family protein n=1 Tax=Niabella agricola TaxID=2891571 RepID=UPI001F28849E|nr:hypothetical protein [Niabella agricola]MCF3110983.1 hypothetical protein [Niabella agricola]